MKFLSSLFLASIAFTSVAQASYLESCQFKAEVLNKSNLAIVNGQSTNVHTPVVIVKVTAATDLGSHNPEACQYTVGKLRALQLEVETNTEVRVGQELELKYFFVSNMSPSGATSMARWNLVK